MEEIKNFNVIYSDENNDSNKETQNYDYYVRHFSKTLGTENVTIENNLQIIPQNKLCKEINFSKWWNSYLSLTKKIDTDGHGFEHSDIISETDEGCLYYINEFTSNVPVSEYPRVLDIGAGDGGETSVLKQRGYNVTGITIGIDNISKAKEQYNIELLNMDMNCLNFEINSFDAIITIQSFEHFLSPFVACIEMWRVLRVGGLCYIDVPSPSDLPMWNLGHTNLLYPDQLKNMFSMCGFEIYKNLSTQHRPRFIFRKLSISKIRNWEQLRFIINERNKVF